MEVGIAVVGIGVVIAGVFWTTMISKPPKSLLTSNIKHRDIGGDLETIDGAHRNAVV